MTRTFDAIVIDGLLHPIGNPQLPENQILRVTVESISEDAPIQAGIDPLAGLARDLGVSDLAENFDDYRFGRREL